MARSQSARRAHSMTPVILSLRGALVLDQVAHPLPSYLQMVADQGKQKEHNVNIGLSRFAKTWCITSSNGQLTD
jgi:hypothetical protein